MGLGGIPYWGICDECGEDAGDVMIVKKRPPLCQYHNNQRKEEKKNEKPRIKPKRKKNLARKATGEAGVFKEIWDQHPPGERTSYVTGLLLSDPHQARTWYFSHILPKAKNRFPMFKLYSENIVFMELEEHETWEHHQEDIRNDPKWQHVFALKNKLLQRYEYHKNMVEQGKEEFYKR